MSVGEGEGDTLSRAELVFLATTTRERLEGYRPATRDNGQIAWMMLEPEMPGALPRFTICRIDPCIMVQIEEADERRFISVASLADAIVIAQRAVSAANARRNVHPAPQLAQ